MNEERFGRLRVLRQERVDGVTRLVCICDCGVECRPQQAHVRGGRTRSCGCLAREMVVARSTTHGLCRTTEYKIWTRMIDRCTKPADSGFKRYGARGITVCERWMKFENFLADMGARPSMGHSLERKENDKGYSKSNCVWATQKEQCNNKRNNVLVTVNGKTQSLALWCDEVDLPYPRVYGRIRRGWSAEKALGLGAQ